jgi:hypothetical protein
MENNTSVGNCFDEFNDIPQKKKDPTIQMLYEYEKHYLEMLKRYSSEIKFIQDMLAGFRKEQEEFYYQLLPDISQKLNNDDGIDNEMKKIWLNRLTTNIERSFNLSETLINDYATKSLDEFKQAVDEKIRSV